MYAKNSVVIDGKIYESFQMFHRVRQGSVSSPMLFNMIMDEITRKSNREG
jgi:hypothetical protein